VREGGGVISVVDVATEKEFLDRATAAGTTVHVLRTTAVAPVPLGGGTVLLRSAIALQYSFETHSENGDTRWVYRERCVADEHGIVDLSNVLLTRIADAGVPTVVFTQRSGSL